MRQCGSWIQLTWMLVVMKLPLLWEEPICWAHVVALRRAALGSLPHPWILWVRHGNYLSKPSLMPSRLSVNVLRWRATKEERVRRRHYVGFQRVHLGERPPLAKLGTRCCPHYMMNESPWMIRGDGLRACLSRELVCSGWSSVFSASPQGDWDSTLHFRYYLPGRSHLAREEES